MTTTQTQIRRDTATNLNAATPAEGELGYDKTNKRLVVGDGLTAGGIKHASAADVQGQKFTYPTVGGTGDAITLTNTPPKTALVAGQQGTFKAGANNTTAVQINEDGLGLKNAKKMQAGSLVALVANDFVAGGIYDYVYDGTQYQIQGLPTGGGGSLKFLGSATASGSSTIDLTSLLTATYDDYLIILDNILPATSGGGLQMRCSADNSTFDSGSHYYSNRVYSHSTTLASIGGGVATNFSITPTNVVNSSAAEGVSGHIYLHNVNASSLYKALNGMLTFFEDDDSLVGMVTFSGLWINTSAALEAVRFFFDNGNTASGTFKVYGIAKS